MENRKVFITFSIFLLIFLLFFSIQSQSSPTQISFILDLSKYLINYTEDSFNDSSKSQVLTFNGSEDKILWVKIPKNSEVLESNITFEGMLKSLSSKGTEKSINDIFVSNINTSNEYDEIVLGTSGTEHVALLDHLGNVIWEITKNNMKSVFAGNLSSNQGLEIVAGDDKGNVYVLASSGTEISSQNFGSSINDIFVSNINTSNEYDEIVLASGSRVYLTFNDLSEVWSASDPFAGALINSISVGNLSSNQGLEIVAGDDKGNVLIWNFTGSLIKNVSLENTSIYSLDVADLNSSSPFDEIVIGGYDTGSNVGIIAVLDKNGNILWKKNFGRAIRKVVVRDVTSDFSGSEIIAGSEDTFVYILSPYGGQIGKFSTENEVHGVYVGNLTSDPGTEIVAGTLYQGGQVYNLFILNYEYFPTNLTVDIGNDGTIDFFYRGKLRGENWTSNNTAFNEYLKACTPIDGFCNVPIVFHSDFPGILNVTSVYLLYSYNTTNLFDIAEISQFSRFSNIWVNESIGSRVKRIKITNDAAVSVLIKYIKTDGNKCDFDNVSRSVTYVNGEKVCDISSSPIQISNDQSTQTHYFWDDTMASKKVVFMNSSSAFTEEGKSLWIKNISIWNNETVIFKNITANFTVNTSEVVENLTLSVLWKGEWIILINESTPSSTCFPTPQFSEKVVKGDKFYVCRENTTDKTILAWKQPFITGGELTKYKVSGFTNYLPKVRNLSIVPSSTYWGDEINVSYNCFDEEGESIQSKTFVKLQNGTEILLNQTNCSSGQFTSFNISTDKGWIGNNTLFFELRDFNLTENKWSHDPYNTSFTQLTVTKRDLILTYVEGNSSKVNRTESVNFVVLLNDSVTNESLANVSCALWVTTNNSNFTLVSVGESNSTGYCSFTFIPNEAFVPGIRKWIIGSYNDEYYKDKNSSEYFVEVYGKIKVVPYTIPSLKRNFASKLYFKLEDEFNQSVNIEGLNVSLRVNSAYVNSSLTNSSGFAMIIFKPDCSYSLGNHSYEVYLTNTTEYYLAYQNSTKVGKDENGNLKIFDTAFVIITNPLKNSQYYNYEEVPLEASLEDSCGNSVAGSAIWSYIEYDYSGRLIGQPSQPIGTGLSLTHTFEIPGNVTIEAYSSSLPNYYFSSSNLTLIKVKGKMMVNMTEPAEEGYERFETGGILTLKCWVNDSHTKEPLEGINVHFFKYYVNT
ncbi:MAG: hypothetical protein J7L39_01720, partial [Candidatus Aenigmarchaeota archaeon]|nr:hypothetical protein [Candidatus Aenigmarchaeota archaeon]